MDTRVSVLVATAVLQLSPFHWISFVQDLIERDKFESVVEEGPDPDAGFGEIVGISDALRRIQHQVEVVSPTDATVLILGETGTGKDLVARAIHRLRDDPDRCAACAMNWRVGRPGRLKKWKWIGNTLLVC